MVLARVVGTVVSSHKEPRIEGIKFLLIEKVNPLSMEGTGDHVVAMDAVGAGAGEIVFFVAGSSSRMTSVTDARPCDAAIVAIVDNIDTEDRALYRKDESGPW